MIRTTRSKNDICNFAIGILIAIGTVGSLAACSAKRDAYAGMTDAQITTGVEQGIAADSRLDEYTIVVTTEDRRVHLSGLVPTSNDRDKVEQIAAASNGVDGVVNDIRFDPSLELD